MNQDFVNIIFGMKVRQARTAKGITLTEFAERSELSPSYVTEIEKGRKYPKADKILRMAEVLDKSYDDLVSIKLAPGLNYLETALGSPLLQEFPFEEFGLDLADLVALLTRVPAKASALLHALLEIGRQYNLNEEHFLRAALRSYQEIHDNYFEDIEEAARDFLEETGLAGAIPVDIESLEALLTTRFNYTLEWERLSREPQLAGYRSVLLEGGPRVLLLNNRLQKNQIKFLLAREIGYQVLGLQERAMTSAPDQVDSFQQVLNDFRASYFGGALLMPQTLLLADIHAFFTHERWDPAGLLQLLARYDVTPEMLLYRFSELIPQFYGVPLHFLRFHSNGQRYYLVKQLNMSRLLLPGGSALDEQFCRRWLTGRLLREFEAQATREEPLAGVQISEFYETQERFLCMGFARRLVLSPETMSSVIVGFRLDSHLPGAIRFATDPAIATVVINETCERCPLPPEVCTVRAAPPVALQAAEAADARREALQRLTTELQTA
ncbi:MAG: XRE family transcriptional regulator [Anaerolineae bacterium]|nr:XRE family transcriptional regulator [Anaerolineae bacterium]